MAEYYYSSKDILDKAIGTDAYFQIKSVLTSTKAADVAPVRHGRWLDGRCTVCGWEEPDVCTWLGYDSEAWIEPPYCPNCGAKMDGDGDAD